MSEKKETKTKKIVKPKAKPKTSSTKKAVKKKAPRKPIKKEVAKQKGPAFLESKKILRLIFIVLFLVLLFTLFNFFSLLKTREELKDYLERVEQADEMLISGDFSSFISSQEDVKSSDKLDNAEVNSKKITPGWRSFGDIFSSDAYLDREKTTLYHDTVVTALSFPPLIEIKKLSDEISALDGDGWILRGKEKNPCLLAPNDNCLLSVDDKELRYNNRKIDLPQEIWDEDISKIDVSFLSTKYLISFVTKAGEQERAFAYFFDGRRYEAVLGKKMEEKIITEYSRPGGIMTAGGDDDDFLLLYSGYEGQAFHYRKGELRDVSRFFGLRVVDGGFYPHIVKQGQGENSLWYIFKLSEGKDRLIKLWQNKTEDIQGAIDLSHSLKEFSGLKIKAFRLAEEDANSLAKIELMFVKDDDAQSPAYLKEEGTWLLRDLGFDNSIKRQAVSINLNYSLAELNSAYINEIFFATDLNSATLYLYGNDNDIREVMPGQKLSFPETNKEIYWKAVFMPKDYPGYSPWFNSLNDLRYYLIGKS